MSSPSIRKSWVVVLGLIVSCSLAMLLHRSVEASLVDGRGIWDPLDADADGMSDEWEIHFFGSIAARDGSEDDDHDDRTTLEEWEALTDPLKLDPKSIGESGRLAISQPDEVTWYPVRFAGAYSDPVVVVGPASHYGLEPFTIRVRKVTSTSFEFQFDEYEYLDGVHLTEEVCWMVVESGRHTLPGGQVLEAGHVDVPVDGTRVNLGTPMPDAFPVILSQVVTDNGGLSTSPRHWDVNGGGFDVILRNGESNVNHFATESLAWILIDKGEGEGVRGHYEFRTTGRTVTDGWKRLDFSMTYPEVPVFLGAVKTNLGVDPLTLRYRNITKAKIDIRLVEEQSADPETTHVEENVGWYAGLSGIFHILPTTGDTDADGLPDAWELANGLHVGATAGNEGYYGDLDGDGLSNAAEYLAGTRADLIDSDGDGVDDFTELEFYGSDALAQDVGVFIPVASVIGSDFVSSSCPWSREGSKAHIEVPRGGVTYLLPVANSGVHAVDIAMSNRSGADYSSQHEIAVSIDGAFVSREAFVMNGAGGGRTVRVLTPWLDSGNHQIEVFWDNTYIQRRINIEGITLLESTGIDGNGNAVPDWVELRVMRQNGIDHETIEYGSTYDELVEGTVRSYTSPYCLEGRARFPNLTDAGEVSPVPGPNDTWFMDVPLDPLAPVEMDFSFENGAIQQHITLEWETLNLIDVTNTLKVRQGDSVRLAAWISEPNAGDRTDLTVAGVDHLNIEVSDPLIITFDSPGLHEIPWGYRKGNANGNQNYRDEGVLVVEVVPRVSPHSPTCMVGFERSWTVGGLDPSAVIQIDDDVAVYDGTQIDPSTYSYSIALAAPETQHVVIRMGYDGPILGHAEIRGVRVAAGLQTGLLNAGSLDDGGIIVAMPVYVGGLADGLTMVVDIHKSGVTFMDGSTSMTISAADIDENGFAMVMFVLSSGDIASCHGVSVWHDGERIGYFD